MPSFDLWLQLVLPAVLASGLVAGLAMARLSSKWWHLGVGAAVAAGLMACHVLHLVFPFWFDELAWRRLQLGAGIAALFAAVLATWLPRRPVLRWLLYLLPTIFVAFRVIPGELLTPAWIAAWCTLALANALVLETTAEEPQPNPEAGHKPTWVTLLSWTLMFAGPTAVLLSTHSSRLSDSAVLMASSLLAISLVATVQTLWLRLRPRPAEDQHPPHLSLQPSALGVGLYLPGLMLSAYHDTFSSIGVESFVLCAAAPLALTPLLFPVVRRWPAWLQAACEILLPLIPTLIAAALAIRAEGWPQS